MLTRCLRRSLVLAKFTQTIVRCRPITQIGAEQVRRFDRDVLTAAPCVGELTCFAITDPSRLARHQEHSFAPCRRTRRHCAYTDIVSDARQCRGNALGTDFACSYCAVRYSRYVARSVQNIDTLLKVIMSPEDPAEEFVRHYLLLVPCQSFSDFQKLLELKVRFSTLPDFVFMLTETMWLSLRVSAEPTRITCSMSSLPRRRPRAASPTPRSSPRSTWIPRPIPLSILLPGQACSRRRFRVTVADCLALAPPPLSAVRDMDSLAFRASVSGQVERAAELEHPLQPRDKEVRHLRD